MNSCRDNGKDEPQRDNASETAAQAVDKAKGIIVTVKEYLSEMVKERSGGISERIYTIPLRAVKKAPRWKRSNRAIRLILEYLERHTKSDRIVLDSGINVKVWERGSKKPPSKIRVRVTEEKDAIKAELLE